MKKASIDPFVLEENDLAGMTLEQRALYVYLRCASKVMADNIKPHAHRLGMNSRKWTRIYSELEQRGFVQLVDGKVFTRGRA